MLTDVSDVKVGHWTDHQAKTGCTVVLLPENTVASGEIRGGAPATREFALLDPIMTVQHVDAVVLSGGSAFGLAACDGVVAELEQRGRGFVTKAGVVPIVVGMSLFDLAVGDPTVRPGPNDGRSAMQAASSGPSEVGLVGAGTGATVNKWPGAEFVTAGGLGAATERHGDLVVSALVAVNAFGAIEPDNRVRPRLPTDDGGGSPFESNTTIGVIVTNAKVDKIGCHWIAQSGHDGLARALMPAHTQFDGDGIVAAATGQVEACLLYTSPSPRDATLSRMPSSA